MKRRGATWWAHWGVLDEISESDDLDRYSERCFRRLREAAERMHPLLLGAMETH